MKAKKLTSKQERFCHAYLETGNASEAYRTAYSADRMKSNTTERKAKELLDNDRIAATIRQLRDELKEVSDIKKQRVLWELNAILEAKITDYMDIKQVPVVVGQDEEGNETIALQTILVFRSVNTCSGKLRLSSPCFLLS